MYTTYGPQPRLKKTRLKARCPNCRTRLKRYDDAQVLGCNVCGVGARIMPNHKPAVVPEAPKKSWLDRVRAWLNG